MKKETFSPLSPWREHGSETEEEKAGSDRPDREGLDQPPAAMPLDDLAASIKARNKARAEAMKRPGRRSRRALGRALKKIMR